MSVPPSPPAADVAKFVDQLPKNAPEVYHHLFEPLKHRKKEEDGFFRDVLVEARRRKMVWNKASPGRWEKELDVFLLRKRGVDVFREWLQLPYVKDVVEEKTVIKTRWEWRTLAHAVADLADHGLLELLLSEYPDLQNIQVSRSVVRFQCEFNL
jgi:hypothetical protein